MNSNWKNTLYAIKADIYRNKDCGNNRYSYISLFYPFFSKNVIALLISYRICRYYCQIVSAERNIFQKIAHQVYLSRFNHIKKINGIEISERNDIGPGLYLPHPYGIVIHQDVVIGCNCTIMQGTTIGNNIFKSLSGVAKIGDNVMICAGAKIIGEIKIGSNVVIGANAVVNENVCSGYVVAGIPAKIIKKTTDEYLINTDY